MNETEMKRNMHKKCPQCGAALPAGALDGLCPACLLQQGAAADTATQPEATRFQPPSVDEVARLFPQLEILAFIGKGGMGAVYKARQPALDRFVALKILPSQAASSPGFAERFNREARALAKLNHPNIVAIHEFGVAAGILPAVEPGVPPGGMGVAGSERQEIAADPYPGGKMPPSTAGGTPAATGLPFFIMEYVDGLNLRQLEQAGKLSPREALQIVPQICEALQFAHDEGIVHRDIKPENILLDKKGRVKIADFGIARIMAGNESRKPLTPPLFPSDGERVAIRPGEDQNLTEQQSIGTPHYMAPEQVEKPQTVDHRADIYSLGVVFYEMLTGELPLGKFAPPSSRLRGILVDVRLDEIVLRALEKDPELRYQRASQVRTDVETMIASPEAKAAVWAKTERMEQSPVSANCATWSPFQSPEVREICAHFTKTEKTRAVSLGALYGVWVSAATFGSWALIMYGGGAGRITASALILLHIALIPTWLRMQRQFLGSTAWAKARGFAPAQLKLFSFGSSDLWMGMVVLITVLLLFLAVFLSFRLVIRPPESPPPQQPAKAVAPVQVQEPATAAAVSSATKAPVPSVPPVVIASFPEAGVSDVDPRLIELQVTFSKPMQDGSWSWTAWAEEHYPETTGRPRYRSDRRTCVLPVKLQPGKVYALWINSEKFQNFRDCEGRPAVPYLLIFETRKGSPPSPSP